MDDAAVCVGEKNEEQKNYFRIRESNPGLLGAMSGDNESELC